METQSETSAIQFRWLTAQDLNPGVVEQWSELSRAACSPNVYLCPEFLVPALNYLHFDSPPRIAAAWSGTSGAMIACGVFVSRKRSLKFPFYSVELARSVHSFQSGLLLSEDLADRDLDAFVARVLADGCRGLFIGEMRLDSVCLGRLIASAGRLGLSWIPQRQYQRPALVNGDDANWRTHVRASLLQNLKRNRRRLERLGTVEVRLVMPEQITADHVDTFLALESSGWRRASSLLSDRSQAEFFKAAVQGLRDSGSVFFVELTVAGRVIASTVNFHVRGHGFGFKIGWDPAYGKFSPGYLVECGLLEVSASGGLPVQYLESGASEGSYLDALWPGRVTMVSGCLVSGVCANVVLRMANVARRAARWIAHLRPVAPKLRAHP